MKRLLLLTLFLTSTASYAEWDDMATAAATGYCLANHPYRTLHTGKFTPDGYEIVSAPGIVGAVRRNYVKNRTTTAKDEGALQSCEDACGQFGELYNAPIIGRPLHQKVANGAIITSGLGDIAASTRSDQDFYLKKKVTVGMWSRGNTFHESDVAQADFCCCQGTY